MIPVFLASNRQDSKIFEVNKGPACKRNQPYSIGVSAILGGDSPRVVSLNAIWYIHWDKNYTQTSREFTLLKYDSSHRDLRQVTLNWEKYGYGNPVGEFPLWGEYSTVQAGGNVCLSTLIPVKNPNHLIDPVFLIPTTYEL